MVSALEGGGGYCILGKGLRQLKGGGLRAFGGGGLCYIYASLRGSGQFIYLFNFFSYMCMFWFYISMKSEVWFSTVGFIKEFFHPR